MRVRTLSLLIAFVVVGGWRTGHAEKVKTNQATKIYNHPGEQGKVILKVKEGQAMTVLSRDGRWLKVRYQGRTGYVPRSKVDLPEADEIVRNTRRRPFVDGRGTKRGFGGEGGPEDRVGADATGDGDDDATPTKPKTPKQKAKDDDDDDGGSKSKSKPKVKDKDDEPDDEPKGKDGDDEDKGGEDNGQQAVHVTEKVKAFEEADSGSAVQFVAEPSDELYLDDPKATKGKWTLVSKKDGDIGYVLTSKLDLPSDEDDDGGGGGDRKRVIDLRGRLGFAIIQEGMSTPGGTNKPPDNYNLGTSSATLALGGAYITPYGKKYFLGGEATLDIDKGFPGISYTNMTTMQSSTIGFTLYNLNLRAMGGYDLHNKKGMVVWGRLGYHYQSFQVADVSDPAKNTALLPSEILKGITFGGALTIPKLTSKIGLGFSLDLMLIGTSLEQTKNLEDGANPSAKAVCFGGTFTYRWKPKMDLQATYDLNYSSLSFGAPVTGSMRMHTGMSSSRGDTLHTIAFGLVYGL